MGASSVVVLIPCPGNESDADGDFGLLVVASTADVMIKVVDTG